MCAVFLFDTPLALAWALAATAAAGLVYNAVPAKTYLGYRYVDQLKDMLPSLALSFMMGIAVYLVTYLGLSDAVTLLVQIPLGVLLYAGAAWLLKMDSLQFVLATLRELLQRRADKRSKRTEESTI